MFRATGIRCRLANPTERPHTLRCAFLTKQDVTYQDSNRRWKTLGCCNSAKSCCSWSKLGCISGPFAVQPFVPTLSHSIALLPGDQVSTLTTSGKCMPCKTSQAPCAVCHGRRSAPLQNNASRQTIFLFGFYAKRNDFIWSVLNSFL